jgi:VWFA-related protein
MSSLRSLLFLVFIGAATVTATLHAAQVQRTIYVTASATDGSALAALSAADLVVKEGGQPRAVTRVEPSRTRLQVAVAVEELLTPDNDVRRAVANFIDRIRNSGDLALYVVGRRSEKRVDYTSEILPFANAINRFAVRSVERGDLVQALHEIARDQKPREGRRALVAVAVETAQPSSVTADAVLEQLAATRSVLYAATLAGFDTSTVPSGATSGGRRLDLEAQVAGLERDKVFNDATRQSGGLHLSSQRTAGLFAALERIAAELRQQYVVSYEADTPSDGDITIEAARRGIVVRGPLRVR